MKYKLIIFASIALILLGAFYWFQYRPSQIKKDCEQQTKDKISGKVFAGISITQYLSLREEVYNVCLHSKGL